MRDSAQQSRQPFRESCTVDQAKDTAMAFVLIGLIVSLSIRSQFAVYISIGILLLAMTIPKCFLHPARIWFGLSKLLGAIVSRIILSIIFTILVIPIGLIRKWANKDTLRLKAFKKFKGTVFIDRNHRYNPDDLAKPF